MTKVTKAQSTSKNSFKIVEEVREHIKSYRHGFQSNINSHEIMTAFINSETYNNSMWDKADYTAYTNINRVCLSFNKIRPIIKQIIGEDEKLGIEIKLRQTGENSNNNQNTGMNQNKLPQLNVNNQQLQQQNPQAMMQQQSPQMSQMSQMSQQPQQPQQKPKDTKTILEGLVRNIAYQSKTQSIYKDAYIQCLEGGFAAWRIIVVHKDGVNSLKIKRVRNPINCYWDINAEDNTKTDGEFCGLTSRIGKKQFERMYKLPFPDEFTDGTDYNFSWGDKDKETLTIGEEYRKEHITKTKYLLPNNTWIEEDEYKKLIKENPNLPISSKRKYEDFKIIHYKFTDHYILEKSVTPFDALPIIFVSGDRKIIGNKERFYSFAIDAKDSQRKLNFIGSEQIEWLKASKRAKFLIPAKTTDNYSQEWKDMTVTSYLHYDPQILLGTILKPEVINPPSMPVDLVHQYAQAEQDIKQALGRYEPNLGNSMQSQESGIYALNLATQGNSVLGVFRRGRNEAIEETGKIIVNAISKVYDSMRVVTITNKNDEDEEVSINQSVMNEGGNGYNPEKIFEKNKYNIEIGVSSTFPMQKLANAKVVLDLISADKTGQAYALLAQLAAENIDVNKSEQIANRLKTLVPPQVLALEENSEVATQMQHQQQMQKQQVQQQITQLELAAKQLANKSSQMDIMLKQQQTQLTAMMSKSTMLNAQSKLMDSQTNRMKTEVDGQLEAQKLQAENMRSMADEERARVELTHKIISEEKTSKEKK